MKLKRPKNSQMCEPGYHIVRSYEKTNSQGKTFSDGYIELKLPFVRVSQADIADPVTNVAAGTRWLFYKYLKIPSIADKNLDNAI